MRQKTSGPYCRSQFSPLFFFLCGTRKRCNQMIATFVLMLKKSYETKNTKDGARVNSFMNGPLCGGHRLRSLGNFLSFQGLQCKNKPSFFLRHWSHFANPFWPYWDFWVLNSKTFWFNFVSFRTIKIIYPPKFYSIAILGLSLSANTILGWVGQKLS